MLKALRIGKGKSEAHDPANEEEIAVLVQEAVELERALTAMDTVLDGQIDQATKLTSVDSKLFTHLAMGVLRFIEATASFETEAIYAAVQALNVSEQSAYKIKSTAQSSGLQTSSYRPGAEVELAEQESSLLGAISMLLTESKMEILKALYKIRKTYLSLEDLRKHVQAVNEQMVQEGAKPLDYDSSPDLAEFNKLHAERTQRLRKDAVYTPRQTIDEYVQSGVEVMSGLLHLILSSVPPNIARLLSVVGLHGEREIALEMLWHASSTYRNVHGSLALIALIMFFDGQLQYQDIALSTEEEDKISEKAESMSIKTVGTSSSSTLDLSEPGLTRSRSKNGRTSSAGKGKTTAKLTPRELRETRKHLMIALKEQRVYYPHGVLWLLQEGRLVTHVDLVKGVSILESPECGVNQMRQVEGLLVFDRTMFLLSLDRLEEAANSFIKLMDVSSWSHPLYMYLSAACHLELYRSMEDPTSPEAKKHKREAEKWFMKAPEATGKKKVLGRKMPFDGFVIRKISKFLSASKAHKDIDFVDVIATSPLYEALYFWNGQSRMSSEVAERAVRRLHYSAPNGQHSDKIKRLPESSDDKFTRELMEATYSRRSHNYSEGYELLKKLTEKVVSGDVAGTSTKKVNYHAQGEPWAGPACLYERAVFEWLEFGPSHAKQVRRWLDLSADWPDDYELSTRMNMKVTGARDRLDIYRL